MNLKAMENRVSEEKEYDVVEDTLQKKIDQLWKITRSNMNCEFYAGMGIMDQIRLEQIDELRLCLRFWKHRKEALAVGAEPEPLWDN